MSIKNVTIDQHGTREETNMEAYARIKKMHGDIRVAQ
jgi:hypothetical protein